MPNLLNLNSAYDYIFRNLSVITYMIGIQEPKFTNIYSSMNLINLSQVAKFNSVYISIP